jgi:hypothetical protein
VIVQGKMKSRVIVNMAGVLRLGGTVPSGERLEGRHLTPHHLVIVSVR